jgi:hypothetical protein
VQSDEEYLFACEPPVGEAGYAAGTEMTDAGLRRLAICFLLVSVPIETLYSWRNGITDPYYLVKVCGWALLAFGVMQLVSGRLKPRKSGLSPGRLGLNPT